MYFLFSSGSYLLCLQVEVDYLFLIALTPTAPAALSLHSPLPSLQPLPVASRDHFMKPAANTVPNTTKSVFGDKFSQLILKY